MKTYIRLSTVLGMIIWSIVGFLIWIPVLLVGTSTFCFEVVESTFNSKQIEAKTHETLRNRINMYIRGFQNFELVLKVIRK